MDTKKCMECDKEINEKEAYIVLVGGYFHIPCFQSVEDAFKECYNMIKPYQPFQIGNMNKKKRIKIAKMLQDAWK